MEFLNKLTNTIASITTTNTSRADVADQVLKLYAEFEKTNIEDLKVHLLCECIFYNLFCSLCMLKTTQEQWEVKDNQRIIRFVPTDKNFDLYLSQKNKLETMVKREIQEKFPNEIINEKELSMLIYDILTKEDNQIDNVVKNFLSFCAAYLSKNGEYHKTFSEYIVYYYYYWTAIPDAARRFMGDHFDLFSKVVDEAYAKLGTHCCSSSELFAWLKYEDFFVVENDGHSLVIKYVLQNKAFYSKNCSESKYASECIERFISTALHFDLYDYPGYYICLLQLIKIIDFNHFNEIFKYKTKLFSKISSDIYQNITLPEVKDCLTFEDMRHSPRFMSKNVGSMTDFIRDVTSKEGERPQDKIFQYVTFFSLWEMAANIESESKIKEENRRKTIIKKFFNAVRTDEWKNKQTLISFLNLLCKEYHFIKPDTVSRLFKKEKLTKLESEIRNASVFLLTRQRNNCEEIQLKLINLMDKIRDEKLLCKPIKSEKYPHKEDALAEITRCKNNREQLQQLDSGFSYIHEDKELERMWLDCSAEWDRKIICRVFHEADFEGKIYPNYHKPNQKDPNEYYFIVNFENYLAANRNSLTYNYLLLHRHLKTHGEHHVIRNLIDENHPNAKINFLKTLAEIKVFLLEQMNSTKAETELRTITYYVDAIDYIENQFFKILEGKTRKSYEAFMQNSWEKQDFSQIKESDVFALSFSKDFLEDFKEFIEDTLNAVYCVQEDFMARYKNQVNLYLYYIAEHLISYDTDEDKIML